MMRKRIPNFEGHEVHSTAVKMSGAIPMDELNGVVMGIDDVVQMVAQFRVVNVHHNTNGDGALIRVHTLRPLMMDLLPWDPSSSSDDGIRRSQPMVIEGKVETPVPVCTCGTEDDGHFGTCGLVQVLGMGEALEDGDKIYIGFNHG